MVRIKASYGQLIAFTANHLHPPRVALALRWAERLMAYFDYSFPELTQNRDSRV